MFAKLVGAKVRPFFRAAFASMRIPIYSVPLLHTDEAKAALSEFGIEVMPEWPRYSPDLNPQEKVRSWIEKALRKDEDPADACDDFCRKLSRAVHRYPSAAGGVDQVQSHG